MFFRVWIFFLLQTIDFSIADHYKGGTISWKPTSPYSLTSTIEIIITERQSWTLSRYPCNDSTINTLGVYNDTQSSVPATLTCISSSASCTSSLYQTISSPLYCLDFSTVFQISTGLYYTAQNLAINSSIDIAWRGASWAIETLTNSWSLVAHIDLTPVSGKINTSPVTGSLPVFQAYVNEIAVIQILAYDWDSEQTVRCRWSYQMPLDECGNICFDLPNATLNPLECYITWTPSLRSKDIVNGLSTSTYVVAVTAEDFTNASSTIPLSSIPHQLLIHVSSRPANACSTRPTISGMPRRDRACYGTSINSNNIFRFTSRVTCKNDSIVEFISSSPFSIQKTVLYQSTNDTWGVNITWSANANQTGLHPFCIASVDNHGQTSAQQCVMIAVGSGNLNLYDPIFVQGTASPVGTVMSTQRRFSVQASLPLKRTMLNGTFIRIYRLNPTQLVYQIDCKYSTDIYFLNNTLVFFVNNITWILGATYYINILPGVGTANQYCGPEDNSFGSNWRFTIWNPSVSSTTTPSTTTSTATTHTVTTRVMGTTTYNTLYTTTGIPAYTTSTTTSTTSTTSTSATTTTTTSVTTTVSTTTTTTAYIPNADVIYPKDMERECLQPVTIATVVVTILVIPLHLYGMINLFVKMNSHFQKETLRARSARRMRLQSALDLEQEDNDDDDDDEEEEAFL